MQILSAGALSKSYGERTLFSNVQFEIDEKDRIGLVGANGAGKTTLFKMLTGEETPDTGGFAGVSGLRIGYMRQHLQKGEDQTALQIVESVFEELIRLEQELQELERRIQAGETDPATLIKQNTLLETYHREGGLTYKARSRSALIGLGFLQEELVLPVSSLSGGQRSKISLARLLVSNPDLLLLDEPTNHLDTTAVEWLEEYLRAYPKAALVISHDRYFLDRATTRTFEIANGKLYCFGGGYTASVKERERLREIEIKQYKDQKKEISRIEGIIEQQKRWNRERNIRTAESKQKQLDKLVAALNEPEQPEKSIRFTFQPKRPTGREVLLTEKLQKSFGEKTLYRNANLQVYKGERVFLLGRNGCGKTTLLHQIVSAQRGVRFGLNVKAGYYDQTQELLNPKNTVFDEISDAFPDLSGTEIRNALAAFLFRGGDVFKRIGELSGGEMARVSLLKLMLSGASFLVLDEPTNHLDIGSREALESALLSYTGSMLIVSHDRYFINKLADRLYMLEPEGTVPYAGNYDYYLEHRQPERMQETAKAADKPKNDYQIKKERASALRKLSTRITRCEQRAQEISEEIKTLREELEDPELAADYNRLLKASDQIHQLQTEEEEVISEWEDSLSRREELLRQGE